MRRILLAAVAGLITFAQPATSAVSAEGSSLSEIYNRETDQAFRVGLQMRLAWTGDYTGAFDGRIDAAALRGIRDFQARHGLAADGVISEDLLRRLIAESDDAKASAGFTIVDDASTGVRLGVPLGYVSDRGATGVGHVWRSDDSAIEIETVRIAGKGQSLQGLYDMLKVATPERSVTRAAISGSSFEVSGAEGERAYTIRFAGDGADLRGFAVSYEPTEALRMGAILALATEAFEPFATTSPAAVASVSALSEDARAVTAGDLFDTARAGRDFVQVGGPKTGDDQLDSSGTGFVVSDDGWLLTNAHVARACKTVLVGNHGAADRVILDDANDLAAIHVDAELGAPLLLSETAPRLGEDVLALGFPLRSILADSLNVTRGNVSSLLGLMNDARYLQISAPIQPGNSGGPLVDLSGRVVGVVTAKLNAVAVADVTGDIPQSINFAVRPDAAVAFLKAHGIAYQAANAAGPQSSVADTTAAVQGSIVPVLCLGGGE